MSTHPVCVWLVALSSLMLSFAAYGEESRKPRIVCSTTQVADFTRQVVGDRCEVDSILKPGQDPHLYEPKPGDGDIVVKADLCIENGWHLEGKDWMRSLAKDHNKKIITCVAGIAPYELQEGDAKVADPHAWFSPLNATIYVSNILKGVQELDPAHRDEYAARADLYTQELRALHIWSHKQLSDIPSKKRILVTSHDAFNYFCKTYQFEPRSPAGWSTGQEIGGGVTPERMAKTVDSIRSAGVKAIFVETSVNKKLIQQIATEAGVRIGGELYSDSMGPPGSAGETYIGMMRENVLAIASGLR